MGYDIPQEIKYEEVIAFNLTFKQLIIAVLFAPIIAYILLPDYYNPWRIIFSSILLSIALGLMFLQAEKHVMNLIKFFRFRNVKDKDNIMKKYLGVEKLNKNSLELTNGKVLSFLEIEPVDVKLMSDLQKEGLAFQFQKCLNSLDFSIQIITTTNTKKFFRKKFFVIIPKKQDLETQTFLVKNKLEECGLNVRLLEYYEIVQVFNNFLKNSTKNVNTTEIKEFSHYILAPSKIVNQQDELIQDNTHSRVISIIGYPRSVNFGFLNKIIKMQEKVDISTHIEPFSIEKLTIKLNSELQKQASDLHSIRRKGSSNPILEIKHADTRRVMEELQKEEEKLFLVSLYLHCKAENFKSLNKLTEKVKNEINSLLMVPKIPLFTQAQALKSCLPLCENVLKEQRNITTKPLSAFFPFTTKFYTQDVNGVEFGKNNVGQPITKDIFKLANHNGVILASSGGGKSYLTKLLVQRYSKLGNNKIFVIDPEGEYTNLVEKLGGQVITIGINSSSNINIFDSFGQLLKLKKIKLHEMFNVLFPDLGEIQRSYLDKAIEHVYKKRTTPFIGQVYNYLTKLEKKSKDVIEKKVLSGLNNRLNMFVNGAFDFMNKQTNIELKSNLVCFYLKDIPSIIQSGLIYLIMDFLYTRMKHENCNKLVFIDEAWSLVNKTDENSFLFKIIKTCRKYDMGVFMISQEVQDLLTNRTGKALLANSATTILLRQKPNVIKQLNEVFNLNKEETSILLNAGVGNSIMFFDDFREQVTITSNEEEHELITLKPLKKEENEDDKKYYPLLAKPCYKLRALKKDEQDFLLDHGYAEVDSVPFGQIRQTRMMVRKRNRENPENSFLVHSIVNFIKKYDLKVKSSETSNPDILFELNGQEWAIEVETGNNIRPDVNRTKEKLKELIPIFENRILFVVTDSRYEHYYNKYVYTFNRQTLHTYLKQHFEAYKRDSVSPNYAQNLGFETADLSINQVNSA